MTGLTNDIQSYLDEIIPNPKAELNYSKDYELLLAVMLSAQTTDKRVNEVTSVLFKKYPTIESLSNADREDIKNIIRPLGTYNKKSENVLNIAKRLVDDCNGVVPEDRAYLESLPGVGRKTANVVLSNLFKENVIAVDTHVSRVSKRLNLASSSDSPYDVEMKLNKLFPKEDLGRLHHQLLLFGRYYCTARNPKCQYCKLKKYCKEYGND